jgi:enamine deaminase RidA (YjgF/YER057c/UK114 family)
MTIFDNPAGVPAPPPGRYSHLASIDIADSKLPTSTTVEVSRLFLPGALLEVEVTAIV